MRGQWFTQLSTALPAQANGTDGVVLVDVDGDDDLDIVFASGSGYGGVGAAGAQPQHAGNVAPAGPVLDVP